MTRRGGQFLPGRTLSEDPFCLPMTAAGTTTSMATNTARDVEHRASETATSGVGPTVSRLEALRIAAVLGFTPIAAGVIARRPSMMAVLERLGADAPTVPFVRRLRERYGPGPLQLQLPKRRLAVVLTGDDAGRVLDGTPEPFNPANREKKGALSPFQPHGVLISEGHVRQQRRRINEEALDTSHAMHHLADPMVEVIRHEVAALLASAQSKGTLDNDEFTRTWWRMVRQIVLGKSARDDHAVTDQLHKLRANGNWSYFLPPPRKLRDRFIESLYSYVDKAEPGSVVSSLAALPAGGAIDPVGQIPHWLFAFDAAGVAASRALALLSTHPEQRRLAREEVAAWDTTVPQQYPYLRACVLESVRLWPTTPTILRDSTRDTTWGSGDGEFTIPAGTAFMILAPAFHRDDRTFPFANGFAPEVWLDGTAQSRPELVPFSAGPAECPGRNLVLFVTSTVLALMLEGADFQLTSTPALTPGQPLPPTLNNFGLRFRVTST